MHIEFGVCASAAFARCEGGSARSFTDCEYAVRECTVLGLCASGSETDGIRINVVEKVDT